LLVYATTQTKTKKLKKWTTTVYTINQNQLLKCRCSRFGKDRGIYFPDTITPLSKDFIQNISEYSNHEIAYEVIKQFVDEIPTEN
jgi:threonine synthase